MEHVQHVFEACKKNKRGVFVAFITCGYPKRENTVDILLALQSGGADVIEVGGLRSRIFQLNTHSRVYL